MGGGCSSSHPRPHTGVLQSPVNFYGTQFTLHAFKVAVREPRVDNRMFSLKRQNGFGLAGSLMQM